VTIRTTKRVMSFTQPFELAGIDGLCPAGSYDIVTDEEAIEGLSFLAWRRIATTILIRRNGDTQAVPVEPPELRFLKLRDGE
jgi:hypothetical protein